jgi:hypothetical protein
VGEAQAIGTTINNSLSTKIIGLPTPRIIQCLTFCLRETEIKVLQLSPRNLKEFQWLKEMELLLQPGMVLIQMMLKLFVGRLMKRSDSSNK